MDIFSSCTKKSLEAHKGFLRIILDWVEVVEEIFKVVSLKKTSEIVLPFELWDAVIVGIASCVL